MPTVRPDRLQLGVCYYPEHWPEPLWEDDFRRMRELGLSVVRMAEFAWSIFEPSEGVFSFELFDRGIALAHEHGLEVILGTPTATPPAWLSHRYPEVLNVTQAGVRYQHGGRRHYTYNAPIYRELSARIVRKLAEHYGQHPAVVGWQLDNELNCEVDVFYAEADHTAFRRWLQEKYGTLERLNQAWGAVFWNQTYSDWAQVRLTGPTPTGSPNPHQALDEKRFFSASAISFARLQADILRELAPAQWVTTNGLFGHLDSHRLRDEALDFISYDSYPNFSTLPGSPPSTAVPDLLLDRRWSLNLSVARSISPRFCVLEQQAGPGGWTNRMVQPAPKPGQLRLWTYQSFAHGASVVLYFRWRTATVGTEIYWHGLNDPHNRPNRRVEEVARMGRELTALEPRVAGSEKLVQVALVSDYDNEWDGELDAWHGPHRHRSVKAWFAALQHQHLQVDALYLRSETVLADLARYEVLIYPHAAIVTDATAELLSAYVRGGGQLVFGTRTGYKDHNGHCYTQPLPGPMADLCGVSVAEYTVIGANERAPALKWCGAPGPATTAEAFNDVLQLESPDAEVLAEYASSYYAGAPALVRHRVGAGSVIYYGAVFNEAVAGAILERLELRSLACDWLSAPPEVELCLRAHPKTGERLAVLLNYSATCQQVRLHQRAADVLTGQWVQVSLTLEPFGVGVLAQSG